MNWVFQLEASALSELLSGAVSRVREGRVMVSGRETTYRWREVTISIHKFKLPIHQYFV